MYGIGEVYRQYADGLLTDDDEVALAHGPMESSYSKSSEPMVNLRATFARAREASVIDECDELLIVATAKELHFPERVFPTIFERAAKEGVSREVLAGLDRFVKTGYVDVKAQDAVLLLQTLHELPEPLEPTPARCTVVGNAGLETLYNCEREVVVDDIKIPLMDIAGYVALEDRNFHQLNFNALNRALALLLGRLVGIEPVR